MKRVARATIGAALGGGLLFAAIGGGAAASAAGVDTGGVVAKSIKCKTATSSSKPFYDGPSASAVYDKRFSQSATVPYVDKGNSPQGLAYWANWDLKGHNLLLVTAYKKGHHSRIYGIDPSTGRHVGSIDIASAHVGGIAVLQKKWVYVSGRDSGKWDTVRKYRLTQLREQMPKAGIPYLAETGHARKVYGASFLGTDGNILYAGKFNAKGRDKMYAYSVEPADGSLTTGRKYEVPTKTQGMTVAGGHFIYSTSYGRKNRGNIYVVAAGATHLEPSARCFRDPSMSEGVTTSGNELYLAFEAGSSKFASPRPRNKIKHLHKAKVIDVLNF